MALSEKDKKRIEEEENYRSQIKKDMVQEKPTKKGNGLLKVLFIIGAIIFTLGIINLAISSPSDEETTEEPVITEEYKNSLAEMFCNNRNDGTQYMSLEPYLDESKSHETTTVTPSQESCKAVAEFCLKAWNQEECEDVANKKIWIGMTGYQLALSWGYPKDKNDTTTTFGVHSQFVYGDFGPYVYLEGETDDFTEMKVTSWQD